MTDTTTLKKGDPVELVDSQRRGVVSNKPHAHATFVRVRLDGMISARYYALAKIRRVVDGKAVVTPPQSLSDDAEIREAQILKDVSGFEGRAEPVKPLSEPQLRGEHIKHYLINYVDRAGKFHVERLAAKGIVMAITMFYVKFSETAVVSVICVL